MASWNAFGTARGEIQLPTAALAALHPLILRRPQRGRLGWAEHGSSIPSRQDLSQPKAMNLKASPSRLIWPALKCPPITSVGVSAKRENNSRRRLRRLFGIGIRGRRPVEMGHLAGMMGDVAGQQGLLAVRLDMDAHMAGAVAGRRDQGDFIGQSMVARRRDRPCRRRRSASRNRRTRRPCPARRCGRASARYSVLPNT